MRKKLLLADDSITIQKVVELTFPSDEFEVVTAGNGRIAVDKAMTFLPDPSTLISFSIASFVLFITPGPDMRRAWAVQEDSSGRGTSPGIR